MSLEDAFLADIVANPDDDAPRLIYADWLEEAGRPRRAEFIRVQCEWARLSPRDPRRAAVGERMRALYADPEKAGQGQLPPVELGYWSSSFRRGFVEGVTFHGWDAFASQAETLLATVPLRWVEFPTLTAEDAKKMADSPLTLRIPRLKAGVTTTGAAAFRILVRSSHLANLAGLDLLCGGVSPRLGAEDIRPLADSTHLARLKELALQAFDLGDEGAKGLAASPHLAGLRRLDLSVGVSSYPIGPAGARALFAAPFVAGLQKLMMDFNRIGDEGAIALARSAAVNLNSLHLVGCGIGPAGAEALASCSGLSGLTDLWLGSNPIGREGVAALAGSPNLAGLDWLDLCRTRLGDEGARILAGSPHLAGLEEVLLVSSGVGRVGAEAALSSPRLSGVVLGFSKRDFTARDQKELRARFGDRIRFDWS